MMVDKGKVRVSERINSDQTTVNIQKSKWDYFAAGAYTITLQGADGDKVDISIDTLNQDAFQQQLQ